MKSDKTMYLFSTMVILYGIGNINSESLLQLKLFDSNFQLIYLGQTFLLQKEIWVEEKQAWAE